MSKKRIKIAKVVANELPEELVKEVMAMYEPSKFEKIVTKLRRNSRLVQQYAVAEITIASLLVISLVINNANVFAFIATMLGLTTIPVIGSVLYTKFKTKERRANLAAVLGKPDNEILDLENKYYFA